MCYKISVIRDRAGLAAPSPRRTPEEQRRREDQTPSLHPAPWSGDQSFLPLTRALSDPDTRLRGVFTSPITRWPVLEGPCTFRENQDQKGPGARILPSSTCTPAEGRAEATPSSQLVPLLGLHGAGGGQPLHLHSTVRVGLSHWHRARAVRGSQTALRVKQKLCTHMVTHMHMHTHTCVCRVHTYVCMHMTLHTCACTHTHTHTCACGVHTYTCIRTTLLARACTHIHAHAHTCACRVHTYTCIHMTLHVCVHTHTCACRVYA